MEQPALERMVRKLGYAIIGLFILVFLAFVGLTLYEGVRDRPEVLRALMLEPGCWIVAAGPLLFWATLAALYFRLPRDVRTASVGRLSRSYDFGAIARLFRAYYRARGFDWLLWVMTLSGLLTVALIVMLMMA